MYSPEAKNLKIVVAKEETFRENVLGKCYPKLFATCFFETEGMLHRLRGWTPLASFSWFRNMSYKLLFFI